MKIADVKTFIVKNPPPQLGGPYWVFVKLYADNNIDGVGEAFGVPFDPNLVGKMIEEVAERHVIGMNPFNIEKLWRIVYDRAYAQHPDMTLMGVLSAIEMALWDIIGKALGQPVYNLLGGKVHERLRSYTYIYPSTDDQWKPAEGRDEKIVADSNLWNDPEWTASRAAHYVGKGFTALKFDPIMPMTVFDPRQVSMIELERSAKVVAATREAVGTKADLLIGTHGQTTPAAAIRFAKKIEPYFPLWFEEPVPPENIEAMALVARATSIPIATGERLATKFDYAPLLEKKAAAIIQPALGRVGGILECKKIAGMAEAHYVQLAPHLYCGPVEAAANIQVATCSPNFLVQESIEMFGGFHSKIIKKPLRWEDGYIIPPTEPGLGVELDEEVALANPYEGNLFPEMRETPLYPGDV
jgi:2-dehydro-3-deoxyphosphogalactonate aldolase